MAVTGPNSHVTGARTTPTSGPEVFESRLAPCGTLTAPEKNRLCRWVMAQAGQAMNQTSCAGSPHPQVSAEEGWPDQTCHHRTMAGIVKQARARRWNPTVRNARRARARASVREEELLVCRRRSQPSSAALTRIARDDVVRWVRRHVHPTGHRRRAYCRASAGRGPARRVRKIEGVPDHRRCVVVGAGLLGLSAAWALTRRGWNVVVLEAAGAPGHERSGSKGDARIFRLGYPEPHYVEMAMLARRALARPRGGDGSPAPPCHRPGDVG